MATIDRRLAALDAAIPIQPDEHGCMPREPKNIAELSEWADKGFSFRSTPGGFWDRVDAAAREHLGQGDAPIDLSE